MNLTNILFQVNNKNIAKRCVIRSRLLTKTPEQRHCLYSKLRTYVTLFARVSFFYFDSISVCWKRVYGNMKMQNIGKTFLFRTRE